MLSAAMMAQTNAPSSSFAGVETYIDSDSGEFDLKTHVVVYRGNVRVNDPRLKLTCDLLTAQLPERGDRIERIVAETNVVIEMLDENGQTNHGTGDKLVYTYKVENGATNEMASLTGNPPRIDTSDGWFTADMITWDLVSKKMHAEGNFHSGPHATNGTNPPPAKVEMPKP